MNVLAPILVVSVLGVAQGGPFPDFGYAPPDDWDGDKFSLSQSYPADVPPAAAKPWEAIDFKRDPKGYLGAILDYCFEGNVEAGFRPELNTARKWFHAPWLHFGGNGREFVRGLTKERNSRAFELSPMQSSSYRNFAVGLYDELGGYTIGRVWRDPQHPDAQAAKFPEGTVTFKLLFTTAPVSVVPFLEGAPAWFADIDRSASSTQIKSNEVRLLQIDVAVKDKRSMAGGWVFGTFHYDSQVPGDTPWKKLRPLALSWGNDPTLTESLYSSGSQPEESWVNQESPIVTYRKNPPSGAFPPKVMGWAGRANGPVDNSLSSCVSCHMTAQSPGRSGMLPPSDSTEERRLRWFRNLEPGKAFDEGTDSLDFSLQLAVGIQNLKSFNDTVANLAGFRAGDRTGLTRFLRTDETPSLEWRGDQPQEYRFSRDPGED